MSTIRDLNYRHFKIAAIIVMLLASAMLMISFYYGKKEFFLLLNADLGHIADFIFNYLTYVGDGLLWLIWLVLLFTKRRRHWWPLIVTSFAATTLFVQVCKQVILPNQSRPSVAIKGAFIHYIDGITVHTINSFPSGHTATAFTFALLISLLTRSSLLMVVSLVIAALVGYTRIYQGQHFPLDVGAGMIVAVIAVTIAAIVQQRVEFSRSG